jgi:hypothetical protein
VWPEMTGEIYKTHSPQSALNTNKPHVSAYLHISFRFEKTSKSRPLHIAQGNPMFPNWKPQVSQPATVFMLAIKSHGNESCRF